MNEATTLPLPLVSNFYSANLPIASAATIEDYIAYANNIPMLTEVEEFDYAKRLQDDADLKAAHSLVTSHLRYVIKIAKKYLGYGLPLCDLIQEGTIGLMKAVRKFDCHKEVRLATFAMHWIKAEIHEFILKNWRIVKIATTKAQRKLFFKLKKSKKSFNWLNQQEIQQIASDLKVKTKDVKLMELRIFNHDSSFDLSSSVSNSTVATDKNANNKSISKVNSLNSYGNINSISNSNFYRSDNSSIASALAPADYIEDNSFNPEHHLEKTQLQRITLTNLYKLIGNLDSRYQDILRSRWLQDNAKNTLQDLALKYGVSKERIRQLEKQAFFELRNKLGEYC